MDDLTGCNPVNNIYCGRSAVNRVIFYQCLVKDTPICPKVSYSMAGSTRKLT